MRALIKEPSPRSYPYPPHPIGDLELHKIYPMGYLRSKATVPIPPGVVTPPHGLNDRQPISAMA